MAGNSIHGKEQVEEITRVWRDLTKEISNTVNVLEQYQKTTTKLPSQYLNSLNQVKNAQLGYNKAASDAIKTQNEYTAAQKENERLNKATLKATAQLNNELSGNTIQYHKLNEEKKRAVKESRDEAKALIKNQGLYNQVQLRVNKISKEYNNLAAKKELTGKLSRSEINDLTLLQAQLNKYQGVLKRVDANIGKHQRNVGNYSSGWNGLQNSITQISREMPAFANSMQTGFMAISNNLPILFDEIARTKKEIASLRAEGKATQGLLGRLSTALFSWGTVLSVGVTLLTVYGKELTEWVGSLFGADKAMNEIAKTQKWLNEQKKDAISITEKASQNASKEIGTLEILRNTIEDVTVSNEDRNRAVEMLQKKYPKYFKDLQREKILNGEVSDSYDKIKTAILQRATVEAAQSQITALITKKIELQTAEILKQKDLNTDVLALVKEESQEKNKLNNERSRESKLIADEIAAYSDSIKQKGKGLKVEDERNKSLKTSTSQVRVETINLSKAKKNANDTRKAAIKLIDDELEALFELINSLGGLTDEEKKLEKQEKKLWSDSGSVNAINAQISAFKEMQDRLEAGSTAYKVIGVQIELLQTILDGLTGSLDKNKKKTDELGDSWDKSVKKLKKFINEVKNLQEELRNELKSLQESFSEDLFQQANLSFLGSLITNFERIELMLEEGGDRWQDYFLVISEGAQEVFNFISSMSKRNFDQEYQALEKQKETAILFAGESTEAREELDKQYEEKKRAIRNREAKEEKELAIFNAIIDTAQAIVSALPNIPLSIVAGAIGAAQIALISSQKVPQFKDGVRDFKGGLAVVGDGGVSEVIKTPDGKTFKTPNRDTLVNLPKGSSVYKNEDDFNREFNNMLNFNGILPFNSFNHIPDINLSTGLSKEDFREGISDLKTSINNKKSFEFIWDENGIRKNIVNGTTKTNILNNRVRGVGKGV